MGLKFKDFRAQNYASVESPQAPNLMWVRFVNIKDKKVLYKLQVPDSDFKNDWITFKT